MLLAAEVMLLAAEAMLLAAEVMLLAVEVMLLHAEAALLHAEVMLLQSQRFGRKNRATPYPFLGEGMALPCYARFVYIISYPKK